MTEHKNRSKNNQDFSIDAFSKKDLLDILNNSFDEIYVIDPQGNTIYVNDACTRNYGATPDELIGKPVQYVEDKGYCTPVLADVFLKKKERITLQQFTAFGKTLSVTSTPVLDNNGNLKFLVLNSRDITDIGVLYKDLEESRQMVAEYRGTIEKLQKKDLALAGIVAESPNMKECLHLAQKVAATDANILLLGESGVGKNLIAEYIHKISNRNKEKMMIINCASIPETLLESELFGYCKGAFSGAEKKGKLGLVELANHGTLFLDEIGEMSPNLQAKLLHLVQEHKYIPIGGNEPISVDIRIIAATNCNIEKAREEGRFRSDLYYRLSTIEINIPPLRKRKDDIPFLVSLFLNKYNTKYRSYTKISPETSEIFDHYTWPGNIREIQHLIERLVLVHEDEEIHPQDLPDSIRNSPIITMNRTVEENNKQGVQGSYREMEIKEIIDLYEKLHSSYKVAEELNISQSKATRIINKYYKNRTETMEHVKHKSI